MGLQGGVKEGPRVRYDHYYQPRYYDRWDLEQTNDGGCLGAGDVFCVRNSIYIIKLESLFESANLWDCQSLFLYTIATFMGKAIRDMRVRSRVLKLVYR